MDGGGRGQSIVWREMTMARLVKAPSTVTKSGGAITLTQSQIHNAIHSPGRKRRQRESVRTNGSRRLYVQCYEEQQFTCKGSTEM